MESITYDKIKGSNEFVVFDIETTGLSNKYEKITEIGAVKIKNNEIIDEFHYLINPEKKISKLITEKTGITNEMVQDQLVYENVLPLFREFIGDAYLVAHNSKFDYDRFVKHFMEKIGIAINSVVIDTLVLSKKCYPELKDREGGKKYSLDSLCEYLSIDFEGHHRAINDARVTAKVFLKMKNDYEKQYNKVLEKSIKTTEESKPLVLDDNLTPTMIKSWEAKKESRIYVNLENGFSVYFDVNLKRWYNKNVPISVDFNKIQEYLLENLKLNNIDEFLNFKGSRKFYL